MRLLPLCLVACLTELPEVADPCATWPDPGLYTLTVDNRDRKALVHVPPSEGPRAAVVMLHGAQSSASKMDDVTRFDVLGQEEGFVSVFPNGTSAFLAAGRTWNADGCCPPAGTKAIDDLGYLDDLVATVERRICTDRTLATGFSNGSMMALHWACSSDAVNAVVGASGPLMSGTCEGDAKPVFLAHGLADEIIPFTGGGVRGGELLEVPSSDETLAVFIEKNRCDPTPTLETRGNASCEVFQCEVPLERCTLPGWGHRYPGGNGAELAGFDLTTEAWRFFEESLTP